mgnify:CR=1 FL=1
MDDLKSLIGVDNYDIVAVTETWAAEYIVDRELALDGYNMIRKDRTNRKGGGVILY